MSSKIPLRIALIDLETAPSIGYVWGKYDQNVIDFVQDGFILSFAFKWLGESKTHVYALDSFDNYVPGSNDDSRLVRKIWEIFDEADVVIAHNGDNFDIKVANARFIYWCKNPPSPYQTVDTLKLARRFAKFPSNRLDDLGRYLNIGRKLAHTGFHTWKGCMDGDPKSWAILKRYNKQDVVLLEEVYLILRSWASSYPNINMVTGKTDACPRCGESSLEERGSMRTVNGSRKRYHCTDCGGWCKGPIIQGEKVIRI